MPRISIGVPFHNVEEYLPQCLDSIIDQTFTDFEVIMVDDGSTDGSFEICQKYTAKDSRFKLFYQENGGVAKARNNCLRHMTGDFLMYDAYRVLFIVVLLQLLVIEIVSYLFD